MTEQEEMALEPSELELSELCLFLSLVSLSVPVSGSSLVSLSVVQFPSQNVGTGFGGLSSHHLQSSLISV